MPYQATISIAGLGPGASGDITLSVWEALRSSTCTYLRTGKHPVVNWLLKENILFSTFDYLYEKCASFEDVYLQIAEAVITVAKLGPVLYAVPGHPLVAEESVRLIIGAAEQEDIRIELLPAVSFLDAVFLALRLDPGLGLQVIDGLRIDRNMPLMDRPALITQVHSRLVAADVKISLLELYPPEHRVTVVRAAGLPGEERIEIIPLCDMDRLDWIDHLTSMYIPEVRCPKPGVGYIEKNGVCSNDGQVGRQFSYNQTVASRTPNEGKKTGTTDNGETVEVLQVYEKTYSFTETGRRVLNIRRLQKSNSGPDAGYENNQLVGTGYSENNKATDKIDSDECCRFPLDPLVDLLSRLRGEGGCPWDREQDHLTLRPYLLEEAYEVLEALNEENMYKLCEELGDLLLQIAFHAQIAAENRYFDMNDVVRGINEKLVRRHPHVFGSATVKDSQEVKLNWKKIKELERGGRVTAGQLDGVSMSLTALMRAKKLQEKAAAVGFDWPDYRGALGKTNEELGELEAAISSGMQEQIESELGDLLFSVVNLSRLLGVDPEVALAGTSERFIRRFGYVENKVLHSGKKLSECSLSELDAWWEEAKKQEKTLKNI
ncbi:MAG: nucleoside triphosphate pyrophosphohydrolase [Desulfotomaculaceae bacterium]|nr:nucleoside triphosphate pyrophosphohydrolase [Desulfotomaculaceae bacterium]